jgi:hypothetical protein
VKEKRQSLKIFNEHYIVAVVLKILFGSGRSIFIEKGRPAEREAGERETSGSKVHVISTKEKLRTRVACWS